MTALDQAGTFNVAARNEIMGRISCNNTENENTSNEQIFRVSSENKLITVSRYLSWHNFWYGTFWFALSYAGSVLLSLMIFSCWIWTQWTGITLHMSLQLDSFWMTIWNIRTCSGNGSCMTSIFWVRFNLAFKFKYVELYIDFFCRNWQQRPFIMQYQAILCRWINLRQMFVFEKNLLGSSLSL